MWLCPQGALLGARVPLAFKSGLARVAVACPDVPVVPVALRYELRGTKRPECFVRVGAPLTLDGIDDIRTLTRRFEGALQAELDALDFRLFARP